MLIATLSSLHAQSMPPLMRGKWVVEKNLSERYLGCYDPANAANLTGTEITIGDHELLWKGRPTSNLSPQTIQISVNAFQLRYNKTPQDLGLPDAPVTITDVHPSEGIPLNAFVLRDGSLLINACNIWLEAVRPNSLPYPETCLHSGDCGE